MEKEFFERYAEDFEDENVNCKTTSEKINWFINEGDTKNLELYDDILNGANNFGNESEIYHTIILKDKNTQELWGLDVIEKHNYYTSYEDSFTLDDIYKAKKSWSNILWISTN